MKYKSYQHIEKIGSSEVDGILNGTCYLTYKIDGTNGCIWLKDDGSLGFGSRNRELTLQNDNAGFMNSFIKNGIFTPEYIEVQNYLQKHPNYIIYGEWLVPHTLKRYNLDAWRHFYVFDIYDSETGSYINYEKMVDELTQSCPSTKIIPLLAKLENPTIEDIEKLLDSTNKFLVTDGLGEGIVIKNYDFVNRFGFRKWAKMLTEDFKQIKNHTRQNNIEQKSENPIEHSIISLLTVEHIQKEYCKLIENKGGNFESKYIFELLNRVFNEFIRDNWEIILKKFRMPTINFKVLKKLSDDKVKETLSL